MFIPYISVQTFSNEIVGYDPTRLDQPNTQNPSNFFHLPLISAFSLNFINNYKPDFPLSQTYTYSITSMNASSNFGEHANTYSTLICLIFYVLLNLWVSSLNIDQYKCAWIVICFYFLSSLFLCVVWTWSDWCGITYFLFMVYNDWASFECEIWGILECPHYS